MTSLAVRLETSSTSRKRDDRGVRERKGENKEKYKKKNKTKNNQAGREGIETLKKKNRESKAKKPCVGVSSESLPDNSFILLLPGFIKTNVKLLLQN